MNIIELKDLIHEILQSDISQFELDHTGTKIRLLRGASGEAAPVLSARPSKAVATAPPSADIEVRKARA